MTFEEMFRTAMTAGTRSGGVVPYPYQVQFANDVELPSLLNVPTGTGKTATAILGWLYRRRFHADEAVRQATPRRLVYCLPMRTLVEQTRDNAVMWLDRLQALAGQVVYHDESKKRIASYELDLSSTLKDRVAVHVLMGGEDTEDWEAEPERDAILIGTQDMLLSRALNRGYGMSRYRWPMAFSMLNNDCWWVIDETQLMGVGLTTTAQLAGLRSKLSTIGTCSTLWMSATLNETPLQTVDHPGPIPTSAKLTLSDADRARESVGLLIKAKKPLTRCDVSLNTETEKKYAEPLATQVIEKHQAGTLTLVVLNRVGRAQDVFRELQKKCVARTKKNEAVPELFLIHSRFRPADRKKQQDTALNEESIEVTGAGRVVVATQAIEAGVDVSATTLFTELAPWSSLVQRFGRCNRRGLCGVNGKAAANVVWIDIDSNDKAAEKNSLPYEAEALNAARDHLLLLASTSNDAGPESLKVIEHHEPQSIPHVLRRKDLLDLFDTTPDLSGNDLDISRYIRETDDHDVQVYWRNWKTDRSDEPKRDPFAPPDDRKLFPPPREELCSVSIGALSGRSGFISKSKPAAGKTGFKAWLWSALDKEWKSIESDAVRPGMVLLFHQDAGGYDERLGWTGESGHRVAEVPQRHRDVVKSIAAQQADAMEADDLGRKPQTLDEHTREVVAALETNLRKSPLGSIAELPWDALIRAAWWHDVGKGHPAFVAAMRGCPAIEAADPERKTLWAKSGDDTRLNYKVDGERLARTGFRHELASALAWLSHCERELDADLIAYLIAAHHGKVRLSIRSMPNEQGPQATVAHASKDRLFARGVFEGDTLPEVTLGNGEVVPATTLSLDLMRLGEQAGRLSWLSRTLALRDRYGPFRLAYFETLLRVADWRGSSGSGS